MEVGCFLSLLPHVAGMKPVHGITFVLYAVTIFSVLHYLTSTASSLCVYFREDYFSFPGAAKVVQQVRPGDDVSDEEAKSEEAASAAAPVRHDEEANYSPLIDRATSKAIAVVENDNMT